MKIFIVKTKAGVIYIHVCDVIMGELRPEYMDIGDEINIKCVDMSEDQFSNVMKLVESGLNVSVDN
jgi:hypothetical protein